MGTTLFSREKYTPEQVETGKTVRKTVGGLAGGLAGGAAGYGLGILISKYLNKKKKPEDNNGQG